MAKLNKNRKLPTLFNPKAAGRPKLSAQKLKWIRRNGREELTKQTPVHVTLKLKRHIVASLRTKKIFKQFKLALLRARLKGLRVLHFSLQRDHVHLLIEAQDQNQLSRGMQSFAISLALSLKALGVKENIENKVSQQRGIFKDRYHVHQLKTLEEVRRAVSYILGNGFKHKIMPTLADCYSSAITAINRQQNFARYFKTINELKIFKQQMLAIVDEPRFWRSKQMYG